MIYTKLVSYLFPIAIATTTPFITADRGFTVGTGEKQITTYLEAAYIPSVPALEDAQMTPEGAVIARFGMGSTMYHIARCESGFRQFDASGEVLRGQINRLDRGIYQINEKYHLETAKRLGHDIYTVEGNLDMAAYILKTQGLQAWDASSKCW